MKRLIIVILSLTMMLNLGVSAAAQAHATDTHDDHMGVWVESEGPTGTYVKIAEGVYKLDPNAPSPRYIPYPSCYDCGSTKFVYGTNVYIDTWWDGCPFYYNGHGCYYCGTRYVDKSWVNHKSPCDKAGTSTVI